MIVQRSGGSSSPSSPAKKQRLGECIALLLAAFSIGVDKDKIVFPEEHISVEEGKSTDADAEDSTKKRRKNVCVASFCLPWMRTKLSLLRRTVCSKLREKWASEEEEEEDNGREDSIIVYLVGDDVFESKTFSKWRDMNWALFDYKIDEHSFFLLPKDAFKPGEDPRSRRRSDELKMGHTFTYIDHPESIRSLDPSVPGTLAILFYNRDNEMGKTMKFESVLSVSIGTRRDEPSGTVYFFTILATETDSGVQKEFQASFFQADGNKRNWYVRALREKPNVF